MFKDETTEHEVKLLKKALQQWTRSNQFQKRIFRIFRNALKYGDCFFVRDPETMKWLYIDNAKVDRIVVNESEGKKPEQYVIRDINPNLQRLSATQITPNQTYGGSGTTGGGNAAYGQNYAAQGQGANMGGTGGQGGRFYKTMNAYNINAEHVIHMSMSGWARQPIPIWTVSVGTSVQSLQTERITRGRNHNLQGSEST